MSAASARGVRPKFAGGRDPAAGPGACWHWREGCPRAAERGCHIFWKRQEAAFSEQAAAASAARK
jgi:hypothetical protein